MIVVLEGLNGTGKSALARGLSPEFGPVVRAFRRSCWDHFSDNKLEKLNSLGIPANTYVEDAFIAEALAPLDTPVILDRSMPSGAAYDQQKTGDWSKTQDLIFTWADSLSSRKVAIVHMVADREVREARAKGRRFDAELDTCVGIALYQAMKWLGEFSGFHVLTYNTTDMAKEGTLQDVREWLGKIRDL